MVISLNGRKKPLTNFFFEMKVVNKEWLFLLFTDDIFFPTPPECFLCGLTMICSILLAWLFFVLFFCINDSDYYYYYYDKFFYLPQRQKLRVIVVKFQASPRFDRFEKKVKRIHIRVDKKKKFIYFFLNI